ncbi:MAG TPA: hypothetical protein VNW97_18480 [Candidatus Saccharimonadales bacterium]|jgi:hypothetical protein|nr:hypothetical protein [Candidatus Saccharimonadales bacterium]
MKRTQTKNILMMAGASAAVHFLAAVVFVPVLSFILLAVGEPPAPFVNMVAAADHGMGFAILAPVLYALIGLVVGGFLALVYTTLTADDRAPRTPVESTETAPEGRLTIAA